MSFLAPLFLVGCAAIALPIVLHLIRRQTRTPIPFSSLRFLEASPPVMIQRRRLEDIFLLVLRCLALVLVAVGFARPFIQGYLPPQPVAVRSVQRVLLMDTSASMRREGLWDQAVGRAERAAAELGAGDDLAVLAFDRRVRTVLTFEEWRAAPLDGRMGLLQSRLAALTPEHFATGLGKALVAAAEAIEEESARGTESRRRQVSVFTDLQQGSRLDGVQGYEWPAGIEVAFHLVQPKDQSNASVQWLVESSTTYGQEAKARIRVRNAAGSQREQFRLGFAASSGAGDSIEVYVPPGQSRVVEAPAFPPGAESGRLTLQGDSADFDNSVFLLRPVIETIRVVYISREDASNTASGLFYVAKALGQSDLPKIELASDPVRVRAFLETPPAPALAIVADEPAAETADRLKAYLDDGGVALWLLKGVAHSPGLAQISGAATLTIQEAPIINYFMLEHVDFEHPLFSSFADARFSDFTKLYFWRHRRVSGLPADSRVLARFDDGDPAVVEIPAGRGRVFLMTSTWAPQDSQLARSSKFLPLLYSFLDQSGSLQTRGVQYVVGDPVPLPRRAGAARIVRPDGAESGLPPGQRTYEAGDPGIYRYEGADTHFSFALNLDEMEGRTDPLPVEELGKLGVPLHHQEMAPDNLAAARAAVRARQVTEAEQKLWRWAILGGLALLLAETALAGWFTRRRLAAAAAPASGPG